MACNCMERWWRAHAQLRLPTLHNLTPRIVSLHKKTNKILLVKYKHNRLKKHNMLNFRTRHARSMSHHFISQKIFSTLSRHTKNLTEFSIFICQRFFIQMINTWIESNSKIIKLYIQIHKNNHNHLYWKNKSHIPITDPTYVQLLRMKWRTYRVEYHLEEVRLIPCCPLFVGC